MPPTNYLARLSLFAGVLAIPTTQPAWADVGVQVGARGGYEFDRGDDPFVGAEARLSFTLSPLTINPTFDYFLTEGGTFYQISVNALHDLPISVPLVGIYVGPGVCLNRFSFDDEGPDADSHGNRLGLNLIGGIRFDLPILRPYAQAMVSIGEIDVFTLGGGILIDIGGG